MTLSSADARAESGESSDIMQMIGRFTVLRLSSTMSMTNISFTKEELLKMNRQLHRIRNPNKK